MLELTDHIRDKVQEALMLTLSKEGLDKLIQAEIDSFFKEGIDGYHHTIPAPFSKMLQAEIEIRAKALLIKWMDTHFEIVWEGSEQKIIGEMVEKFIPITLKTIGASITSSTLELIHQQLSGRSW